MSQVGLVWILAEKKTEFSGNDSKTPLVNSTSGEKLELLILMFEESCCCWVSKLVWIPASSASLPPPATDENLPIFVIDARESSRSQFRPHPRYPPVLVLKGAANLSPANVGKSHARIRRVLDNLSRVTFGGVARPRIAAVHPGHEATVVSPEAKDEHHAAGQGLAHNLDAPALLGPGGRGVAVRIVDVVGGTAGGCGGCVVDKGPVLDVEACDVGEGARSRRGVELGDDGERQERVDLVLGASAVEVAVAVGVGVVTTAPLVAVPGRLAAVGLGLAGADPLGTARVWRVHSRARVGLPNVHLVAAGAELGRVCRAVDEAEDGTLRVAVAGAVFRACRVEAARCLSPAVQLHVGEVQRAVHAAGHLGQLDIKSELVAEERDVFVVFAVGGEKIGPRRDRDNLAVGVTSPLVERKGVSGRFNPPERA